MYLQTSSVDWALVRFAFHDLVYASKPNLAVDFDSIVEGTAEDVVDLDKIRAYAQRLGVTSQRGQVFVNGKHIDLDEVSGSVAA
jgi:hypothetical protein